MKTNILRNAMKKSKIDYVTLCLSNTFVCTNCTNSQSRVLAHTNHIIQITNSSCYIKVLVNL